ncbi:MAG: T9SS type A sorting domain-containing protein [Bacteroidales bacterium]|nr:T9SS type A sorting domain-containing protein [Bacteroidales bacterium]
MNRTYKLCIVFILCFFSFSVAQANTLKESKNIFSIKGTEVPDSIMKVMEYCAETWSKYISTDVPIQVSVSWQELKSNVNAYAKPTNYYAVNGVYYPAALAEKIQGKNLNGTNPDIEVVINKTLKWYLDYTKIPESLEKSQYDLTTTLMHELAHGLGYIGNITSESLESTDFPSPTIFDMLVSDKDGNPIVTRKNDSFVLNNTLLNTNALYWNGKFAKAYCGEKLKLYAPEKFNSGSTVYHLDEDTYLTGCGFELMTPVLRSSEIFRTPDIATIAIIADLGWNDFFITHEKISNSTELKSNTLISFSVKDTLLDKNSQSVFYSFDGWKHSIEIPAIYNEENNLFEAEIPALPFDHTISYSILSVTTNKDSVFIPSNFPENSYSVFVGEDTEAPEIYHTPLSTTNNLDITISADINDNFEIDTAFVQYFVQRGKNNIVDTVISKFKFTVISTEAVISLSSINQIFEPGDVIYYNIIAVDNAGNTSYFFGEEKFQAITLEEKQEPIHFFITDFDDEDASSQFILDKCSIKMEDGFASKALHTSHPYAYTGIDGKYNQYTATLKSPIIIASNPAIMTFDEVVLVEPGKAGIEYGTFGFWDFVIVEGTKDLNSDTWYALGKVGWDSQIYNAWKTRYYSSTKNDGENDNSLAVGDSTLFKTHKINLLENKYFRAGDTIYVRFRLQSDATNYAWGWAIDNLTIQGRMALSIPYLASETALYPNPCRNEFYVSDKNIKSIKVYDLLGKKMLETTESPVNTSALKKGTYTVSILYSNGIQETKQIIKE